MLELTKNRTNIFLSALIFVVLFSSCNSSNYGSRTARFTKHDRKEKSSDRHKERKYVYSESTRSEKAVSVTKPELLKRDEIVLSALNLTGRDYRPGGKTPESGFDCSGFTSYIFRMHGFNITGSSDQQAKLGRQKNKSTLEPGDLVFFGNEDRISHVGIVASHKNNELEIVHSTTSAGVKIDNISKSDYWQSRFLFGVDIISGSKDFQ
ncbi:MAG: C40 family peptidase [Saprospiraceae bacterium]|jgi:cell wall-associated NlpC family hydrolase|nr:C40 family peptidase [Saprospiraceae bacterium]